MQINYHHILIHYYKKLLYHYIDLNYDTSFCNVENQSKTLDECQAAVDLLEGVTDANLRSTDMSVNKVPVQYQDRNPSGCFRANHGGVEKHVWGRQ